MPAMCRKYERPRPPRFLDLVYKFKMRLFFAPKTKYTVNIVFFYAFIGWKVSFSAG